jgi:hypothetical protein
MIFPFALALIILLAASPLGAGVEGGARAVPADAAQVDVPASGPGGSRAADSARQIERPLPDPHEFAARVRARLKSDRTLLSRYTYVERREEIKVSKLGKIEEGPVKLYEVYPSREPGNTYKRLIAVDGVPLTPEELEKRDSKHRDDVLREMRKRESESPEDRAKRLRKEAKERAEEEAVLAEIFELYNIRLVGRDVLEGETMIVATLDPKRGYDPRTDAGKLLEKVRARVWVSEADHQIARIEAEVIDDVTYGWGILARLHKGSRAEFVRRKVNDEVWLPAKEVVHASGRSLLFRSFKLDTVTTYSDYRKFEVATEETYGRRQ